MMRRLLAWLSWLHLDLYAPPTPQYVVIGLLGLGLSLWISFGLTTPGLLSNLAQLLALLGSSRLFTSRVARSVWWLSCFLATIGICWSACTLIISLH